MKMVTRKVDLREASGCCLHSMWSYGWIHVLPKKDEREERGLSTLSCQDRSAAPPLPNHLQAPNTPIPEDVQLFMAINASIQTALVEGVSLPHGQQVFPIDATNDWGSSSANPNASAAQLHTGKTEAPVVSFSSQESPPSITIPSTQPILDEAVYGGPIHYLSIDSSPVYFTVPPIERSAINSSEIKEDDGNNASSSTCVICLDKPVEGACIPCDHMTGCMSYLKEIKEKKGDCPVCRAKIDQVVRLYVV